MIYCWKVDAYFCSYEGRDQSANDQIDLVLLFFRSLVEAIGIPIAFPNSQFDCHLLDCATGASVLRSKLFFKCFDCCYKLCFKTNKCRLLCRPKIARSRIFLVSETARYTSSNIKSVRLFDVVTLSRIDQLTP